MGVSLLRLSQRFCYQHYIVYKHNFIVSYINYNTSGDHLELPVIAKIDYRHYTNQQSRRKDTKLILKDFQGIHRFLRIITHVCTYTCDSLLILYFTLFRIILPEALSSSNSSIRSTSTLRSSRGGYRNPRSGANSNILLLSEQTMECPNTCNSNSFKLVASLITSFCCNALLPRIARTAERQ